jgi:hypothetical protein
LFVYCLFVLVHFVFGLLPFLKKMGGGGERDFKGSELCLCLCVFSELSNEVLQFLLFSAGTLRQCGYLIATTHLIPTVTGNKIVDLSN